MLHANKNWLTRSEVLLGLSARGRGGDVTQSVPVLPGGSIRDTVAVLAGNFLLRQLFLGGGLGVEQQCVDQEQRLICVLPLAKLVVPNHWTSIFNRLGSISTLTSNEPCNTHIKMSGKSICIHQM